jgi:Spy/CpxP family protein refolding chaperone
MWREQTVLVFTGLHTKGFIMKRMTMAASLALAMMLLAGQGNAKTSTDGVPPPIAMMALDAPIDHGWMGGPGGGDVMDRDKRIARHVAHLLHGSDVTKDQIAKITSVYQAAAADLAPLHANGRELHQHMGDLLSAPSIDRAAIETVRVQLQQMHETGSRRMTQARIEASEVLTPAQRVKVAAMLRERGERMHEHAKQMREHMREHMNHMKDDPHHGGHGQQGGDMPPPPPALPRN